MAERDRKNDDPLPAKKGESRIVALKPIAVIPVLEGEVRALAFTPDSKTIATGYFRVDGSGVVLWDRATQTRLKDQSLLLNEGWLSSVAMSPDGKIIAAGYASRTDASGGVMLWDGAKRAVRSQAHSWWRKEPLTAWPLARTARPSPPDSA